MPWPTFVPAWPDLPGLHVAELRVPASERPRGESEPRAWLVRWDSLPAAEAADAWAEGLDARERDRAARIGTPHGRTRFLASHAALHRLGHAEGWAHASLSHTRWCAAVAVSPAPIGVDLEADVPRPGWPRAARARWPGRRFPSGGSQDDGWADFLRAWVAEEALFKAGGDDGRCTVVTIPLAGDEPVPPHVVAVALARRRWGIDAAFASRA